MATVPDGIGFWWVGTNSQVSSLSGWDRVTDFDDRFVKGTANVTDPNATGGSSTHIHATSSHTHTEAAHTHTGTFAASPLTEDGQDPGAGSGVWAIGLHTHAFTTGSVAGPTSGGNANTWTAVSSNPDNYRAIYIESDGTADGFPDDVVCYYDNASAPTGWTQHAASVGRFFYGATGSGNGGGTAGDSDHTHTPGAHTHTAGNHDHPNGTSAAGTGNSGAENYGFDGILSSHTHSTSMASSGSSTSGSVSGGTSSSTDGAPPYHKLLAIQNTSSASVWLEGAIAMWRGTLANIPDDWLLCDGGDQPDLRGKFILNDASGGGDHGATGGNVGHNHTTASHTHSSSHSHTMATTGNYFQPYGEDERFSGSGGNRLPLRNSEDNNNNHTHGGVGTSATDPGLAATSSALDNNTDTQPAFRTVAFLEAPEEPKAAGSAIFFGTNF
jgi:hypothetical protein